jgi:hypothetical protein
MYICGLIKSKSLTKFNNKLGYHYEAVFVQDNGLQIKMKYAAELSISVGYKYYFRQFYYEPDTLLQLDKKVIYVKYNKMSIIGKLLILKFIKNQIICYCFNFQKTQTLTLKFYTIDTVVFWKRIIKWSI